MLLAHTVSRAVADYRATRPFGVPAMFIALLNNDEARGADYGIPARMPHQRRTPARAR